MEVHYVPRGRTRHEVATAALVIDLYRTGVALS